MRTRKLFSWPLWMREENVCSGNTQVFILASMEERGNLCALSTQTFSLGLYGCGWKPAALATRAPFYWPAWMLAETMRSGYIKVSMLVSMHESAET